MGLFVEGQDPLDQPDTTPPGVVRLIPLASKQFLEAFLDRTPRSIAELCDDLLAAQREKAELTERIVAQVLRSEASKLNGNHAHDLLEERRRRGR
jgi:hypothetical protein